MRTGSLSLAGLVIGDKMLAASKLSAPAVEQAGSFTEHAKKVWSDYSTKRPAPSAPEAGLDVRELLSEYFGYDLRI